MRYKVNTFKGPDNIARKTQLFDEWPDRYDSWFETPLGSAVKRCEQDLILEFLAPHPRDVILDAGCGTGVFTLDIVVSGATIAGLDLSLPMLKRAVSEMSLIALQPNSRRSPSPSLQRRDFR